MNVKRIVIGCLATYVVVRCLVFLIHTVFLAKIKESFETNPDLENLLLDPDFADEVR